MKWLTRSSAVVAVAAAVFVLVPVFVTLSDYIPEVEKALSERLHEPVSIDSMRAALLPAPHITAEGVAIGSDDAIKVSKLTLKPDFWSLFKSQKVIRSAEIEDVTLSREALGALLALAQREAGAGSLRIESVKVRGAVVKLGETSFGPLDGEVRVRSGEQQGELTLATRDGALDAHIAPKGDRYALTISARSWTAPVGLPIRFETLSVKGLASAVGAELSDIDAKLYGGTLTGKASIGWREGLTLKGQLDVKQIELKDAAAVVAPKARVSGRLDAKPVFSAQARQASQLDEALRIETPFTVHGGVLHGVDLGAAVAALANPLAPGGQTRFDELSGHLVAQRGTHRFTQLRMSSGALSARGQVTVAASKALSGQLSASVKGVGAALDIPLTVAGTVDAPVVYPNPTALIGAAAGTVILGPGLGSAVGGKLGEIAEGMLGRKKKR